MVIIDNINGQCWVLLSKWLTTRLKSSSMHVLMAQ